MMSVAPPTGTDPDAEVTPESGTPPMVFERHRPDRSTVGHSRRRTRAGLVRAGVGTAAVTALVIFMVQDTGRAIYSLWVHGSTFIALALLVAVVGAVLLTLILGIARLTQQRHLSRRANGRARGGQRHDGRDHRA
jgi:uncharacterized integral membrane protein